MPKPTRSSSGQLRSHSRSSSGTRLGANLQFTAAAKDVQPAKQPPPGGKKGGAGAQPQTGVYDALNHDIMFAVAHHGGKPPFVRANSSQRVQSREQLARRLAPLQQPPPAQQQQQQQHAKTNGKAFSIQAQAVDAGEDDEDEWESENGAATPNQDDSGSDTASENGPDQEFPDQVAPQQQYPEQQQLDPRRQPPAMTAQQEQIMAQQRKEAEIQHQLYLRQRQLEAQHRQQQKVDQERHLLQQQQQQQEQYQQELRLQQQRQIQAQQQQQQQQQYQQQQQNRQLQQQEQQQLYLQQQQQQQQLYQQQHPPHIQTGFPVAESELARVNTARPSDFEHALRSERPTPRTTTPSKQQQQEPAQPQPPQRQQTTPQPQPSTDQPSKDRRPHTPRSDSEPFHQTASATGDTSEAARHSPRPKHISRPPSSHSIRSDHGLRPHPLFRGLTQGVSNPVPRPAPLAPLTVLPASTALPAISTSPPTSIIESVNGRQHLSSSPTTSIRTSSGSPAGSEPPYSAFAPGRRMSISSARSAASTLPPQSASGRETVWTHDRTRTLSTMSTASSSAALSSLANLPSVTRPPSPQTIAFFPPVNPHSNVEAIHPLLPGPYLHNHLTVLSRRTPIRESFDRVMRAKNAR